MIHETIICEQEREQFRRTESRYAQEAHLNREANDQAKQGIAIGEDRAKIDPLYAMRRTESSFFVYSVLRTEYIHK